MEKKKNNALEKAEKATVTNSGKKSKKSEKKATNVKKDKKLSASEKRKVAQKLKEQRKEERARIKAEKEKALAEKRVELARIKAHKKAEKEKAKATALREKNRRKAEAKAKRMQIIEERKKRRELLRSEDKKQREARLLKERQQKREAKERKLALKREERERKARDRQKNKERNRGRGGWIAAVISLGVATLVLSSVLTFNYLMPSASDNMLDNTYKKSYFDTVEQVDNIDLNLAKAIASDDSQAMQRYLVDAIVNSELAENDIQQLPLQDESKFYTTKLINQIGDYAKYLNNKLINGEELTETDLNGLVSLYRANQTLKNSLQKTTSQMGENYSFSSLMDGKEDDLLLSNFNELQNLSVQYPEMIYDGPFSDGQAERTIKGLSGDEIDKEQAVKIFMELFEKHDLTSVQAVGEVNSGDIHAYNVQGEKDGEILYAQIAKKGGKLLMFAFSGSCREVKAEKQEAIEVAENFLLANGVSNMKPVWINLASNVYTINFAYEQNGVIVYPDLIKVRVCAETKMVIGYEAKSYYTNHTERIIGDATLTREKAEEKVSSNIEVQSARLAIVPIGTSSEKLCYEFQGTFDGSTYYVYIDAVTGRQVELFKVIESTEGELLI